MSPCTDCHAGCCRSFAVPVTGADILRIERELDLSFWDFACRWADPHGAISRRHAPQFHFADEPQTPFVICLTHESSRFLPETSKCRFLVECPSGGEHAVGPARCGIYRSRPMACRGFPARLNQTAELAVLCDVPARGRDGDHPAYNLCPRPWEPADLDPLQTVQDLIVARYEMAFFHQLARLWNRTPRAWAVFPDFLRLAYAGRIVREDSAESEAAPTANGLPQPGVDQRQSRRAA